MLLATFVRSSQIDKAVEQISSELDIDSRRVFLLKLVSKDNSKDRKYVLTYNWHGDRGRQDFDFTNEYVTISVNRKKQTNTIYTINALNSLIKEEYGPTVDPKTIKVDWDQHRNTMLIMNGDDLKSYKTFAVRRYEREES